MNSKQTSTLSFEFGTNCMMIRQFCVNITTRNVYTKSYKMVIIAETTLEIEIKLLNNSS